MEQRHVSVCQAARWAFKAYATHSLLFVAIGLLLFVSTYAYDVGFQMLFDRVLFGKSIIYAKPSKGSIEFLMLFRIIANQIVSLLFGIFCLGLVKITLGIYDHGKAEFKTLFSQWRLILPAWVASIIFGIGVSLGLALFIIPGLWIAARYCLYMYVLVDKKSMDIFEAFRESYRLTTGATWHMLGLFAVGPLFTGLVMLMPTVIYMLLFVSRFVYMHLSRGPWFSYIKIGSGLISLLLLIPITLLMLAYAYRKQQEYSLQLPIVSEQ
jgi:hypothetical protein